MSHQVAATANPPDHIPVLPNSYRNEALVALAVALIITVSFILKQYSPNFMTHERWIVCLKAGGIIASFSLLFCVIKYFNTTSEYNAEASPAIITTPHAPKQECPRAKMMKEFYKDSSVVHVAEDGAISNLKGDKPLAILQATSFKDAEHLRLFIEILTSAARDLGVFGDMYHPSKFTMSSGRMLFEYALDLSDEQTALELLKECRGTEERVIHYFLNANPASLAALSVISTKLKISNGSNLNEAKRNYLIKQRAIRLLEDNCNDISLAIVKQLHDNGFHFGVDIVGAVVKKLVRQDKNNLRFVIGALKLCCTNSDIRAYEIVDTDTIPVIAALDDQHLPILKEIFDGAAGDRALQKELVTLLPHAADEAAVNTVRWIINTCKVESAVASYLFFSLLDDFMSLSGHVGSEDELRLGSNRREILKLCAALITKEEFALGMNATSEPDEDDSSPVQRSTYRSILVYQQLLPDLMFKESTTQGK